MKHNEKTARRLGPAALRRTLRCAVAMFAALAVLMASFAVAEADALSGAQPRVGASDVPAPGSEGAEPTPEPSAEAEDIAGEEPAVDPRENDPSAMADSVYNLRSGSRVTLAELLRASGLGLAPEDVDDVRPAERSQQMILLRDAEEGKEIRALQPFNTARLVVEAGGKVWIVDLRNGSPEQEDEEAPEEDEEIDIYAYDTPLSANPPRGEEGEEGPAPEGELEADEDEDELLDAEEDGDEDPDVDAVPEEDPEGELPPSEDGMEVSDGDEDREGGFAEELSGASLMDVTGEDTHWAVGVTPGATAPEETVDAPEDAEEAQVEGVGTEEEEAPLLAEGEEPPAEGEPAEGRAEPEVEGSEEEIDGEKAPETVPSSEGENSEEDDQPGEGRNPDEGESPEDREPSGEGVTSDGKGAPEEDRQPGNEENPEDGDQSGEGGNPEVGDSSDDGEGNADDESEGDAPSDDGEGNEDNGEEPPEGGDQTDENEPSESGEENSEDGEGNPDGGDGDGDGDQPGEGEPSEDEGEPSDEDENEPSEEDGEGVPSDEDEGEPSEDGEENPEDDESEGGEQPTDGENNPENGENPEDGDNPGDGEGNPEDGEGEGGEAPAPVVRAATIELTEVPVSLSALLRIAEETGEILPADPAPEASPEEAGEAPDPEEGEAPEEPAEDGVEPELEDDEAPQAGEAPEDEAGEVHEPIPAAEWQLEYDEALLAVEFTGEDYQVMPVAGFEAAALTVRAGDTYLLTLGPWQPEETPEAYPAQAFEGQTRYLRVSVQAPEGAFPAGTTMRLRQVYDEDTLNAVADTVEGGRVAVRNIYAVDIAFFDADGGEIEPLTPISVEMALRQSEETDASLVVHVDDGGNAAQVSESEETLGDGGAVRFESDAFSVYAFVLTELLEDTIITSRGETYRITLTCGEDAAIPEGARLEVREILEDEENYPDYAAQAAQAVRSDVDSLEHLRLFDISILYEGQPVEPAAPVSVRIEYVEPVPDSDTLSFDVVHFAGDRPEVIAPEVSGSVDDVDTIDFTAESFSVYAVVGKTLEKVVLASDGRNYRIRVTYGPEAGLPADAELVVEELEGEAYADYLGRAAAAMEAADFAYGRVFDITLVDGEGAHLTPAAAVEVTVELLDAAEDEEAFSVVHFDGEEERPEAVQTQTEGQAVSFSADSFSAYAIVRGPSAISDAWVQLRTMDELRQRAGEGLYIGTTGGYYLTDTTGPGSQDRNTTGILKTKPAQGYPAEGAARYYFEPAEGDRFYIYCLDGGNRRQYVRNTGDAHLTFAGEEGRTAFTVVVDGSSRFRVNNGNRYWNMWNGANGNHIAAWTSDTDANNYLYIWRYVETEGEPYGLDGKTYGLMSWTEGTSGKALMALADGNGLAGRALAVMARQGANEEKLFVPSDSGISLWRFEWAEGDKYYLSTVVDGLRKYLRIQSDGLALVGTKGPECRVQVLPGTGSHESELCLRAGGVALAYSGSIENGFRAGGSAGSEWLRLVELSELTSEYFMTYSASKVSVSAPTVTNGSRIIVYARSWNDAAKKYEFYAVDHDGTLVRCYESGDSIQWLGQRLNTLLWNLVEYYWDGTDEPNHYYELYNQYSEQYVAPQVTGGQTLSPHTIGINLNGRRNGEYYTSILAWDDENYAYAGLKVQDGRVVSCPIEEADDFYFAVMQDIPVDDVLTTVPTVDHTQGGITMRLVDFGDRAAMSSFLGSDNQYKNGNTEAGLLSTDLGSDGFPVTKANRSLGEWFRSAPEVNHLFVASTYHGTGYYEYDSTQNFARLNGSSFDVYQQLGTMDGSGSGKFYAHGQFMPFNDLRAGLFASGNPRNTTSATGANLPEGDPRKYERLYLVQNPNYYLGVELEASFTQTPDGLDDWGHDIIYEFTGDDDFWLYVDGELIIDLGGIHDALPGSVNYRTGEVSVNGKRTTLRALFEANYRKRNPQASTREVNEFLNHSFEAGGTVFRDYSAHTMKIFYLERGAGASNLHMRFNLASIKRGTVELTKTLSGVDASESVLAVFPYQVWVRGEDGGARLLEQGDALNRTVVYKNSTAPVTYLDRLSIGGAEYPSVFLLKPGETAEITLPKDAEAYRIVECGVDPEVYTSVRVNGAAATGTAARGAANRLDYATGYASPDERARVVYDNAVNPQALRTLTIRKQLFAEDGTTAIRQDAATFSFRLYLATELDDDLDGAAAAMYTYHVKDPDGSYCRWDSARQRFVSLGVSDYARLDEEQQVAARFATSLNGSISKIPANYTVEVRELLAGTRFRVVERPAEIPDGYSFQKYVYGGQSYAGGPAVAEAGVEDTVVSRQDPHVDVCNLKGWGLRLNKVWADADYMAARDAAYFAVFTGASEDALELVPGTVRRLPYGASSLYWYFLPLPVDVPFDQYEIRELRLENPVVDASVEVTAWDEMEVIHPNGEVKLNGRQKGEAEDAAFTYAVTYRKGEVPEGSNVRVDTARNDRPGVTLRKQDMAGNPLAGATFTLADAAGSPIGEFTSDEAGLITTAFLSEGRTYTLTETAAPQGFRGLEAPMTLRMEDGALAVGGADEALYTLEDEDGALTLVVRNRPFTLRAIKRDGDTGEPLPGVTFALHRQYTVDGVTSVATEPLAGYEALRTGADGVLPLVDETLPAGTYQLRELEPLDGYWPLEGYVNFTLSADGAITLGEHPDGTALAAQAGEDGSLAVELAVSNARRARVRFRKVDADALADGPLAGAEFDLYRVDGTGADAVRQTPALYTGLTSGEDGMLANGSGEAVFELPLGTYHLVETKAPKGYDPKEGQVVVTVAAEGVTYDEGTTLSDEGSGLSRDGDGVYTLLVSNARGYTMPSTGGRGTAPFAWAGTGLVALALFLLWRRRGTAH